MTKVSGIFLDTSVLDHMTAQMKPKGKKIVNTYGQAIAEEWSKNVRVDTSHLRNTILSESHMEGDLTFVVQDGTGDKGKGYADYQEFGTRKMSAHPALIPAVEHYADKFLNAFAELFK